MLLLSNVFFAQNKYFTEDGDMTDYVRRELSVSAFNAYKNDSLFFDFENENFIVNSSYDFKKKRNQKIFEENEFQKASFYMLCNEIKSLKKICDGLVESKFEHVIIKTYGLTISDTKRIYYKFSLDEIKKFPYYIDFKELLSYVYIQNQRKNIIFIKE